MEEAHKTPKSYIPLLFGSFISVNLLCGTQFLGVESLNNTHALLPINLFFLSSILKHLLVVLKLSKSGKRTGLLDYHLASFLMNLSLILLFSLLGQTLDISTLLQKEMENNRRMEKAGFVQEGDEEYNLNELQLASHKQTYVLYTFMAAYMGIAGYLHVIYRYNFLEGEHFMTLGHEVDTNSSFFSWQGLSSAMSSWSVVGSGGAGYNVGANTVGSVGGSLGAGFTFLSHLIFPITVVLIGISVYSLRKNSIFVLALGATGGMIILVSSFLELGFWLLVTGNVILIGASLVASQQKVSKKAKK